MTFSEKDYKELKDRQADGEELDDDSRRLIKQYERGDYERAEENAAREADEGERDSEEQFNPSKHTVNEVNEYLKSVEDDEDEWNRVIEAEEADKGRTGIIGRTE